METYLRLKELEKKLELWGLKAKAFMNSMKKYLQISLLLNYEGSSKETEKLEIAAKEIIYQCSTKQTSSYLDGNALRLILVLW